MITTLTLNPSVDKTYYVDTFHLEESIRVSEIEYAAGGSGLNIAKILNKLDVKVLATGFIGGYSGNYIKTLLDADKIKYNFTKMKSETRSCIRIIDQNHQITSILENGGYVSKDEVNDLLYNFDTLSEFSDIVTISGSIPQGLSNTVYNPFIEMAKKKKKTIIFDAHNEILKEGITYKPTCIKPYKKDLEFLFNKELDENSIMQCMKQLYEVGIKHIIVPFINEDTSYYLNKDGIYKYTNKKFDLSNENVCSEAMIAALAYGFQKKKESVENVKYALAMAINSQINEEVSIFDIDIINTQIKVEKVG